MAKKSKFILTFQDIFHYATRFVKYWKIATLLFLLGLVASLVYYTYGTPTFYSRSLVAFTNLTLPLTSETSDVQGRGRYAQVSYQLIAAFNSRWLLEQTAKELGLVSTVGNYEMIRDKFIPSVRAGILPGNLLQFEVYAYTPKLVHDVPQAMIRAYRRFSLEQRAKHREAAIEGYGEEMNRLRDRIASEQDAKQKFEEDNRLIEQYVANNGIESVPSEMLTIKTRLDSMDLVENMIAKEGLPTVEVLSLIKKFRGTPVPVGTIMRQSMRDNLVAKATVPANTTASITSDQPVNPTGGTAPLIVVPSMVEELDPWETTERDLRSALQERQQAAKIYLPGHEMMRTLDKKIQQLTASMDSERSTAITSFRLEKEQLKERFDELQKKMPDYRRVLNDFDKYRQEFSLMTSGNVFWENAYGDLKKRLAAMEHTGIDMKVEFDFQGFTKMRDDVPISPSKQKLLMYALILGIGAAAAGSFGLEKLRSTTSLVTETEKLTGLHAVGVVPLVKDMNLFKLIPDRSSLNSREDVNVGETFRIIRCSIPLHVARDNRCQVIMVSSSRPSEGKTVVSSMLARSFAEADQRTLLIDADLRRGRLHRLLEIEQNGGLSGFLSGEIPTMRHAVLPTKLPTLEVLTRGKQSLPRYEALGTDSFINTINDLRKTYDRIIIDTPPLLGLADSLMVSRCVDGALFVVRAEQTTQRDILTALEVLQGTQTPIYGLVLNGVDLSKVENYYYYSSYYPKYYDPSYAEEMPEAVTA